MLDEPAEYGADAHDYDPIDPKLGHYYLWDGLRKRTHVSVFGESEFATWERARFVRGCSTMWPFLRIRRVWLGIGFKEQAREMVVERRGEIGCKYNRKTLDKMHKRHLECLAKYG